MDPWRAQRGACVISPTRVVATRERRPGAHTPFLTRTPGKAGVSHL